MYGKICIFLKLDRNAVFSRNSFILKTMKDKKNQLLEAKRTAISAERRTRGRPPPGWVVPPTK